MENQICEHIQQISELKTAKEYACEACEKEGSRWLHLRTCQTCGATLCCDSSPMKHMTKHYYETGHPVAISSEPGERWLWCYKDESFVEY
jgi:uncharacterized UBP type Zn finger protein